MTELVVDLVLVVKQAPIQMTQGLGKLTLSISKWHSFNKINTKKFKTFEFDICISLINLTGSILNRKFFKLDGCWFLKYTLAINKAIISCKYPKPLNFKNNGLFTN